MNSVGDAQKFNQIENNTLAILQELKELRIDFVQHLDDRLKARAHAAVQTATTYQDRVRAEYAEHVARTERLEAFLPSPTCNALPPADQALLATQFVLMTALADVLKQRIDRFV